MGKVERARTQPNTHIAVGAVFAVSLAATVFGYAYERQQVHRNNQAQFEQATRIVADDLTETLKAYGQFLRGGAALFHASETVSREEWRVYVQHLELEDNYPGIHGVSYNPILRGADALAQFEGRVQRTDWPRFQLRPAGDRALYAPVLYLEPLSLKNESAVGYDIYSEAHRQAAADRAIATGRPSLTSRITLVQEDGNSPQEGVQSGVLLILPVYDEDVALDRATSRLKAATGLIVSVFRMGDLIESTLSTSALEPQLTVNLYDATTPDPDAAFYQTVQGRARPPLYSSLLTMTLYGRDWTMQTFSTQQFEADHASYAHYTVLGAGSLVSLLLTSLVWGQAVQHRISRQTARTLQASNARIELLSGEINHRSKNLLSLVQVIARQTSAGDPQTFAHSFSRRLGALAASQDLMVKSKWVHVELRELVRSQLAHFDGLIGSRIFIEGDELGLEAATAQTLGMAIHELATNAGKYGALSDHSGTVNISWRFACLPNGAKVFKMSWIEDGGPRVTHPKQTGFGSKVTVDVVTSSLAGSIEANYEPNGFKWHLVCPAHKVRMTAA